MIGAILPRRGIDRHGSGAWGAPRGARTHKGVDYACYPGTEILSPRNGVCTKLGYPYGDDLSFRYVEITDERETRIRFFYVTPALAEGDAVKAGDLIGTAQDIVARYPGITGHIHVEMVRDGNHLNPDLEL